MPGKVRYAVIWTGWALSQVRQIYDHVKGLASEASAEQLANELLDCTELLTDHPRLYPIFPESIEHVHHIVVRPEWRVLYVVDDARRCCTVVDVVSTRLPYQKGRQ